MVFRDRVSLSSLGCPGTHFVDQAGLELRNPPASASTFQYLKTVNDPSPVVAQGHVMAAAIFEKRSDGFVCGGLLWKNLQKMVKLSEEGNWLYGQALNCYIVLDALELLIILPPPSGSGVTDVWHQAE